MTQRVYIPFMMFNARIVNMQHLWSASYEYLGKKTEKPNYFLTAVTPKTRGNWWEEPTLAGNWAAYEQLLQKSGMTPQHITGWPVKDGDLPPEIGKAPADWAKGHWIIGGSSSNPIKVEIVQGPNTVPLPARVGVKPGDYVALGLSAAIKQNDPRAMKHFCNTVLFMGPGEEIAVGNSVSGADLMTAAQQQGMQVIGFAHASPAYGQGPGGPGGFPGAGQQHAPQGPGGFAGPGQGAQPNFGGGQTPAYGAGPGAPGFSPGTQGCGPQGAPMTGNPATPGYAAPGLGGTTNGFVGNVTFPSNPGAQQYGQMQQAPFPGGPAQGPGGAPQFTPPGGPQFNR